MTSTVPVAAPELEEIEGTSLWRDAWRRLKKNRMAVAAAAVLGGIVLFCVAGPLFVPYSFDEQNLEYGARGPSAEHWFGTDLHGRDLLVRTMYGGRISLAVGLAATLVSLTIGVAYGAIAGYFGGRVDAIMMRVVDVLYTLPFMFVVILFLVLFGRSIVLLFVALGAVSWLTMARIVRGQVLSLKQSEFVDAARSLGARHGYIIFREILPNLMAPILVYATLLIPTNILFEAALSFLGVGINPPTPTWGGMLSEAVRFYTQPHFVLFPGLAIFITVLAFNLFGDGLRDAFDPRTR